ncbi:hypothetical protein [Pseudalkalibacillus salsuginis]|uniref:hypothetical protein n=1 Tax=Pseudalkalibacillus salsuginis TaxID=2910972 RepID=UPI001F376A8D|nr:hypothetical protein [Pseudalkalibacillus salsuginis]MCF6409664.1 hypothetical protein [Pseudalkalibacillus salsuginis]
MKVKYIVLTVISLGIVLGMLLQTFNLLGANDYFSAALLLIGLISFVGYISMILKKLFPEFKHGLPSNDERSKKVKYYSAGRAYFFSLYIWIALLAFQKYLDKDDTLILGILGMVLSLFVSWLFTKNKRGFE